MSYNSHLTYSLSSFQCTINLWSTYTRSHSHIFIYLIIRVKHLTNCLFSVSFGMRDLLPNLKFKTATWLSVFKVSHFAACLHVSIWSTLEHSTGCYFLFVCFCFGWFKNIVNFGFIYWSAWELVLNANQLPFECWQKFIFIFEFSSNSNDLSTAKGDFLFFHFHEIVTIFNDSVVALINHIQIALVYEFKTMSQQPYLFIR